MEKTAEQFRKEIVDVQSVRCGFEGCKRTVLVNAAFIVHLKHVKQFEGTHWSKLTMSQISQAGACFCPQHRWWPIQQKLELRPAPVTINFLVHLHEERSKVEEANRAREAAREAAMKSRFTIADAFNAGLVRKDRQRRRQAG